LANCASEALRAAAESITAEPGSHIVKAVFGMAEFDEKQVYQRQELLHSMYAVSIDVYKAHRPRIIKEVIYHLNSDKQSDNDGPSGTAARILPPKRPSYDSDPLLASSFLHYRALATTLPGCIILVWFVSS
jgi:hypothetical protein